MKVSTYNASRFDITSMRVAVACFQTGSLTAAARQNHLALAAASRRIRDLEDVVGSPLFIRHPKGMTPTATGRIVAKYGLELLHSIDQMGSELADLNSGATRHISLFSSSAAITEYLPPLLAGYEKRHPAVRVDVKEMVSESVVKSVREGRVEIGIFVEGAETSDLSTYFFRSDELVFVFSCSHRFKNSKQALNFSDTLDEEWICLSPGAASLQRQLEASLRARQPLKIRMQLQSFEAVCNMVSSGLGIALLPKMAAMPLINGLRLSWRPVADPWAKRNLLIATKPSEIDNDVLQLVEFLVSGQFYNNSNR